jgi:hypothetical protein
MTSPPAALLCCTREATEPEGAGHDVDCPGPEAVTAARAARADASRGTRRKPLQRCAPTLGRHVTPHRRCPEAAS